MEIKHIKRVMAVNEVRVGSEILIVGERNGEYYRGFHTIEHITQTVAGPVLWFKEKGRKVAPSLNFDYYIAGNSWAKDAYIYSY